MVSLLLWVCLASSSSDCHVELVVDSLSGKDACERQAQALAAGWLWMHPSVVKREGTGPFCVNEDQANYLVNRFKA